MYVDTLGQQLLTHIQLRHSKLFFSEIWIKVYFFNDKHVYTNKWLFINIYLTSSYMVYIIEVVHQDLSLIIKTMTLTHFWNPLDDTHFGTH